MKKITAVILVLLMCLGFSGCGTETVELTPENFREYFTVRCGARNCHEEVLRIGDDKFAYGEGDIVVTLEAKEQCEVSDVYVTMEFQVCDAIWMQDEKPQLTVHISDDGKATGMVTFSSPLGFPGMFNETPPIIVNFTEIMGSVEVKK